MEIWKPIKNYPGYEVSNYGRIKSYKKDPKGKILSGKSSKGYVGIDFRINGETKQELVHRIVLSTFSPIEGWEKLTVNHIDGDKTNNNLENLEWMTQSENTRHARKILQSGNGTKRVHIIKINGEELFFETVTEAAKSLQLSKSTISKWVHGSRSYKEKYRLVEYL